MLQVAALQAREGELVALMRQREHEVQQAQNELASLLRYRSDRSHGDRKLMDQLQKVEHVAAAASAVAAAAAGADQGRERTPSVSERGSLTDPGSQLDSMLVTRAPDGSLVLVDERDLVGSRVVRPAPDGSLVLVDDPALPPAVGSPPTPPPRRRNRGAAGGRKAGNGPADGRQQPSHPPRPPPPPPQLPPPAVAMGGASAAGSASAMGAAVAATAGPRLNQDPIRAAQALLSRIGRLGAPPAEAQVQDLGRADPEPYHRSDFERGLQEVDAALAEVNDRVKGMPLHSLKSH